MPTLTQDISRFVAGLQAETPPAEVTDKARSCLVNALGMAVNGFDTPYAPVARKAAIALDGEVPNGATLFGDGRRSTVSAACLANSALFHGRAQEDTCGAAHFGTILIPMLLAMTEARSYPLSRLIPALVAGYETGGLFENAFAGRTTPAGFRSSAVYGCVAAAAAAGKLMELDEDRLAAALANAVSFTGGVLQSFADGTDEWRYQVGVVARNGLLAAELAAAGSVSAPNAFEGRAGFVRCFAGAEIPADLAARLGRDWSILRVTFKPYPVCAFNQTPVTGALALRQALAGREIAAVRVRMNPYETGYAGMDAAGPFGSISGTLMSIPFCIATTLVHGVPSMRHMTTYDDAAVNGLVARTTLVTDPDVPVLSAIIEADTTDGTTHLHEQRMTPADYAFDRATLRELLTRTGAEQGLEAALFERIERAVDALPNGRIEDFTGLFTAIAPRRAAA
jgi:2-methylcitrate dehydratase PrpD